MTNIPTFTQFLMGIPMACDDYGNFVANVQALFHQAFPPPNPTNCAAFVDLIQRRHVTAEAVANAELLWAEYQALLATVHFAHTDRTKIALRAVSTQTMEVAN